VERTRAHIPCAGARRVPRQSLHYQLIRSTLMPTVRRWCVVNSIFAPCCMQHLIYAKSMCVAQGGCREAVRRGRRQSYCLDDLVASNHQATQSVIMGFSGDGRSLIAYSGLYASVTFFFLTSCPCSLTRWPCTSVRGPWQHVCVCLQHTHTHTHTHTCMHIYILGSTHGLTRGGGRERFGA
jgi:hypothetical protein